MSGFYVLQFPGYNRRRRPQDAFCKGLLSDTLKTSCLPGLRLVEKAAQQTSSSTHEVAIPTKPPQVQSSGSSSRCHWCGPHTLHGKAGSPVRDKTYRKSNHTGHFQGVCLTQKGVAGMERHSESDDSDVVASLTYKQR